MHGRPGKGPWLGKEERVLPPYFLPIDAPHFGHFNEENRKPGLGGTSVLQAGQRPAAFVGLAWIIGASLKLFPPGSKFFPDLMGFCPFLWGIFISSFVSDIRRLYPGNKVYYFHPDFVLKFR
jgi:hypothetical protein